MMQAGTCVHEVEKLGFVSAGGRTQGHPAGAIGLVGGRHWCFLVLPSCRGLTIVNHKVARYRVAGRLPAGRAAIGAVAPTPRHRRGRPA
jgi:hypothetical protein